MNEFLYQSATVTVFYQTGLDEFNEPAIASKTYRNLADNVTAAQLQAAAQAIVGLTDFTYLESVKTQKDLVSQ